MWVSKSKNTAALVWYKMICSGSGPFGISLRRIVYLLEQRCAVSVAWLTINMGALTACLSSRYLPYKVTKTAVKHSSLLLKHTFNYMFRPHKAICRLRTTIRVYRVSQEERTKLREGVPYVKVYRYNPKHIYPKLNGYGDNGKRSLKLWQLLHTYWLPNSYWNSQGYVVSVMLISVLNIKLTCEWHKAIKLNYKNTRTHITVFLRVTKHCTYRQ